MAGVVESGQTPEESVILEIREETGYRVCGLELVTSFYLTPGGSSERIYLFYAEIEEADREREGGGLLIHRLCASQRATFNGRLMQ